MKYIFRPSMIRTLLLALSTWALAACGAVSPQTAVPAISTEVAPAPTQVPAEALVCNTAYTRHVLPKEAQWDQNTPEPVFTLGPEEFGAAMQDLGISSVCVPEGVGAPYLRLHSNMFPSSAVQGVMAQYRFDEWPKGAILYSTYDVRMPTEYDTFASAADYDAIRNASAPGFERIKVGLCYGRCTVYKTFIYPFKDHYVAVTVDLGAYEYGSEVDNQVARFNAGEYPLEMKADLERFDTLVHGLKFAEQ
jgi:hypothetical protein